MNAQEPLATRRFPRGLVLIGALALVIPGVTSVVVTAKQKETVPTAREIVGPAAVVPLAEQPPARIVIDPPLPDQLAKGRVVIQYRTENLRILPVFGPAAAGVLPRIGHLHLTLDDLPWHWVDTSGQELIINGLAAGPHKLLVELADANHKPLAREVVKFEIPQHAMARPQPITQHAAKLIVNPPQPERLARGVVFIEYRTENLQILPVFGQAALDITPRIGHLHITVDESPWRWGDASGGPLVVAGLPAGQHQIKVELVNANHQTLAQEVVKFEVPAR